MKIIDRYVILSFIRNYVISFMVLVGMYVVLDMVFNFNNLVDFSNKTGGMPLGLPGPLRHRRLLLLSVLPDLRASLGHHSRRRGGIHFDAPQPIQ